MAINTKLTTIEEACLDIRDAIKESQRSLADGAITTLGNDIRTLNNGNYVYKWVNNNGTYNLEKDLCTGTIAANAYLGNTSLIAVILPENLTTIGSSAFKNCTNLQYIALPRSLTSIQTRAFEGCTGITDLDITSSSLSIGTYAFYNCTKLVTISSNVPMQSLSVAEYSFRYCPLTSFPTEKLTSITGQYVFHQHRMTNMEFNSTLTSISSRAFISLLSNGTSQTIIMRNTTPPTLGNNQVFHRDNGGGSFYVNTGMKIYVPYSVDQSILNAYKTATNWTVYADYIFELNADGSIPT